MAMIDYSEYGEIPDLDDLTNMAFSFISMQMDRDKESYTKKCVTNKENGAKGGRPKKQRVLENDAKTEKTERFSEKPKKPDKDKDKDEDKDIINNTMCKADADALFEKLWKLYPHKRGKGKVSEANKRRLLDIGYDRLSRAIDRYKADLANDTWKHPQNGSTFFNSGYVDYLDENYEKPQTAQKKISGANFDQRSYDYDALTEKYIGKINGTNP
jgi:hypothetical protein